MTLNEMTAKEVSKKVINKAELFILEMKVILTIGKLKERTLNSLIFLTLIY